jgi:hypothetical protein
MQKCFIFFFFLIFFGCDQPKKLHEITPAFYYWKSEFVLKPSEQKILQTHHIKKLYVKFFDIDIVHRQPVPTAVLRLVTRPDTSIQIIPTVFITNRSILSIGNKKQIDTLAKNIKFKIESISKNLKYKELQIDCDWTPRSRASYFALLVNLKKQLPASVKLSATIRLHQIKFPTITGVPPVDRGMLMCYNMADWQKISTNNSIFDPKILAQYIQTLQTYTLPLDIVFPSFRWTIFYRNGRFLKFINNLDANQLQKCSFLKSKPNHRFECQQDTFAMGISLRKGDLLRTEVVLAEDLITEKEHILSKISNQKLTFTLFHLDSTSLAPYSDAALKKIFAVQPQN